MTTRLTSFSQLRGKFRRMKRTPPGASPGMISIAEDAKKPVITIFSYNEENLIELDDAAMGDIKKQREKFPEYVHWIHIKGLGDSKLIDDLISYFHIHRLEMEDVMTNYQRPKMEEHDDHLFIVSRMIYLKETEMMNDQLSLFLGDNFVLIMQENYEDLFEMVRQRLRQKRGLRKSKADYLAYAIMDATVDNYFPILEKSGELLDELELELLTKPTRESLQKIQLSKRKLIVFRRTIFAERDKVNDILRTHTEFVSDNTKIFLRDTYDHIIQVMDLVESYKEITASMMDIYLSSVSNRMNQIMKVLAVISTIFIPLTFIVGVYGMNFVYEDAVTGKKYPLNMPELYSPYGYVGVWAFMMVVVIFQLIAYYKRGWLSKS